jgi:peroxiredoxin
VELPRLQTLFETYSDRGLEIVAVEANRDTERAQKLITDENLTFTFVENGEGEAEVVRSIFGVSSYPTTFLIDRNGRILHQHVGFEEGDEVELAQEIEALL